MFKNKIYIYLIKAGIDEKCWTFDKPIAFLSTCHPELVGLDDIFLFAKSESELSVCTTEQKYYFGSVCLS